MPSAFRRRRASHALGGHRGSCAGVAATEETALLTWPERELDRAYRARRRWLRRRLASYRDKGGYFRHGPAHAGAAWRDWPADRTGRPPGLGLVGSLAAGLTVSVRSADPAVGIHGPPAPAASSRQTTCTRFHVRKTCSRPVRGPPLRRPRPSG